ncbi:hypothetical protein PYCCODRAFT_212061 [Trametes coccinea BRFM310]|uniref:Uncharacterized protein n=1 Tax=Trametes coccinea (strain BRFM310) TaxID=1353009 RepID=A0A1Y2IQL3_TRAC3|nr:hypothetical protein PYCCODRAFT_212061 [Trametes coccinea BRFM310]
MQVRDYGFFSADMMGHTCPRYILLRSCCLLEPPRPRARCQAFEKQWAPYGKVIPLSLFLCLKPRRRITRCVRSPDPHGLHCTRGVDSSYYDGSPEYDRATAAGVCKEISPRRPARYTRRQRSRLVSEREQLAAPPRRVAVIRSCQDLQTATTRVGCEPSPDRTRCVHPRSHYPWPRTFVWTAWIASAHRLRIAQRPAASSDV